MRLGLLAILLVVLALAAVEAIHLRGTARDLTSGADELRQAAATLGSDPSGWTPERILSAQRLGEQGLAEVRGARAALIGDPLVRLGHHLPYIRDQVVAVVDLARGAAAAGVALQDQVAVARAYDAARRSTAPPGHRLIALVQAAAPPLEHASSILAPPLAALRADSAHNLLPPLASRVQEGIDTIQPRLDQASAGAGAGRYLPVAMGGAGPRQYLLLFPNPAELRPSGGFGGVIGSVGFTDGTPQGLQVQDSDTIDAAIKGGFPPPQPMAKYVVFLHGHLDIGDNLEPDFPTQAATSEAMFKAGTGKTVDGTISIDPYAVEALLGVTGPVTVPGYGSFTSTNFFTRLDTIVNVDRGPGSGKAALVPISRAVIAQVLAQPLGSYLKLLTAMQDQVSRRHLQLSLHDPQLAKAAAAAGADGAIVGSVDDYAMVVDANVGATKGDFYIHKSMSLKGELPASGVSRHQLTMRYDLPTPVDAVDRALNPYDGSYHDYVRFYLPQTATLKAFSYTQDGRAGNGSLDSVSSASGKQVIGAFFILPRGHVAEIRVDYEVALNGRHGDELYIQKQAGIPGFPVNLDISYPGGRTTRQLMTDRDQHVRFAW